MNATVESSAIKAFWDEQAKTYKESDLATAPDHYYRELEIARIIPHLQDQAAVLDIGCGNGFSTLRFAERYPKSTFVGADYSEAMVASAISALHKKPKKRVSFTVADVLKLDLLRRRFDIIVSERCLINLRTWEEQKKALLQMKYALNSNGKIILVENTKEGLASLNRLRADFGLHPIQERWHNSYLPQKEFTAFAKKNFKIQHSENIGNLYYILSRVVYAKMAKLEGKEPEYENIINKLASQLPSLGGYSYSPNMLWILRSEQ